NFTVTPYVSDFAVLSGITLNLNTLVQSGGVLGYQNGLTINKTLRLQSESATGFARLLRMSSSSQTIGGTGEVVFDGPGVGVIFVDGTTTFGPNLTVRTGSGSGSLDAVGGSIMNQGRISAQTSGASISIKPTLTNIGRLEAINGGSVTNIGTVNNTGLITIGAGSTLNAKAPFTSSNTGTIGGAGLLHVFANASIAGPQNWLSGASMVAERNLLLTLDSNAGAAATATTAAKANLTLAVVGDAASVVLRANQDLAGLDVQFGNSGNQSLSLSSASGAGAFRAVRVYAADLEAARDAIYAAIANAN